MVLIRARRPVSLARADWTPATQTNHIAPALTFCRAFLRRRGPNVDAGAISTAGVLMPRIRTIKPDFWRHRQLASVSQFARLAAIALLNMADDEGYFEADPVLIRGDVFPYECDCSSITVALQELELIGYVVVVPHPIKGPIGFIPGFLRHQVINKPSRSKLRALFESVAGKPNELTGNASVGDGSGSVPVVVRESSGAEMEGERGNGGGTPSCSETETDRNGNGTYVDRDGIVKERTGTRRKRLPGAPFDGLSLDLPPHVSTPAVLDAWKRWCLHQYERDRPMTEQQARASVEMMARMSPRSVVAMINRTIAKNWSGLTPCPPGEMSLWAGDDDAALKF